MQCFSWPGLLVERSKSVDIELIICTFADYTRDEFLSGCLALNYFAYQSNVFFSNTGGYGLILDNFNARTFYEKC